MGNFPKFFFARSNFRFKYTKQCCLKEIIFIGGKGDWMEEVWEEGRGIRRFLIPPNAPMIYYFRQLFSKNVR